MLQSSSDQVMVPACARRALSGKPCQGRLGQRPQHQAWAIWPGVGAMRHSGGTLRAAIEKAHVFPVTPLRSLVVVRAAVGAVLALVGVLAGVLAKVLAGVLAGVPAG